MRWSPVVGLLQALVACGHTEPATPPSHVDEAQGLAIVAGAGCGVCHALGERWQQLLAPPPMPSLVQAARRLGDRPWQDSSCRHWLREDSADIAAWVRSLLADEPALQAAEVRQASIDRGERLVHELACAACHAPTDFESLPDVIDHARLAAFLIDPGERNPGLRHLALPDSEAGAVAAWLLRRQKQDGATVSGFAYECFELQKDEGELPRLEGLQPSARGVTDRLDVDVRSRDNRFALRFTAAIAVPTEGDWTFTVGSDDGSWLWIDDRLVVENGGLKPHERKSGTTRLSAGPHELRVCYTQGGGGKSLEVLWQGPALEREELAAKYATATVSRLVPRPATDQRPAAAEVERGRVAARAARCDQCHEVKDEAYLALPEPPPATPWSQLGDGACARSATGSLRSSIGELPAGPVPVATRLRLAMLVDGCLSCHVRDGDGGLPPVVQKSLTVVEDLGDEGQLPPDLSAVGRRLRPEWLERVVRDGHKARDYVRMHMPAYGEAKAKQYAAWFAEVDAKDVVDAEPPFSAEAVALGRQLVGTGGRNCITCHSVQGHASLGPLGMDLSLQHQRVRPGWFREWLLHPTELRPNTRMPTLWLRKDARDLAEVDAIRTWMSLGEAAPLPHGLVVDASSYVLEPIERPILHGAFLKDVSARCLAVGTPERTHFAFDLATPRLCWLWRGAFLDVNGTWHGRAGKLLEPLGKDWQRVDDFTIEGGDGRRLIGQRRTSDGYPVLQVACGDARYEDDVRPRLAEHGSEVVRTIRCQAGELNLQFPVALSLMVTVDGKPAQRHVLKAGQSLEVIYRW